MKVAVCVPTYRRPAGLARLLVSLGRLQRPDGVALRLVVVDNDVAGGARATVDAWSAPAFLEVRYAVEPRRGVSHVRNTLLELTADCDFVAFIDDDETAAPDWLAALLERQRETGAAAVTGPTRPVFTGTVPDWMKIAFEQCYIRPRPGTPLREITTSNLLLDRRAMRRLGLRFEEALSLVGGEDTFLAFELVGRGETIAWAAGAVTHEFIPESRARLGWLLRRWYRTGNIEALLAMRRRFGLRGRIAGAAGGAARLGIGGLALLAVAPGCLAGSPARSLKRLYTVARGAGMLASVCGRSHQEYATIHGG